MPVISAELAPLFQLIGGVGIGILDLSTQRLVSVNAAFCRITGYSEAELLRMPYSELTHPQDAAESRQAFLRALDEGADEFVITKRYQQPGGEAVWVRIYMTVLRDETGQARQAIKVVEDISAEKKALLALARSERRQAIAVDSRHLAIWEWDLESGECFLSDGLHQLLGLEPASLAPRIEALWELVHPDDRAAVAAAVDQHLKDNRPYDQTYRLRRADGVYLWVQDRGRALRAANGQAVLMAGSVADVTAQKQAEAELQRSWAILEDRVRERTAQLQREIEARERTEQELRTSQERLWLALSSAHEGFFDFDLERRDFYVSPCIAQMLGEEVRDVATSLLERVHPEDRPRLKRAYLRHWIGRTEGLNVRFRVAAPDGNYRWAQARGQAVTRDCQGRALRVAGTLVDVTSEEMLRQQLEQATLRAEKASQAKSAFLANMSHEIRTPLNGILGLLELLADSELSHEQRDLVQTICQSARSLLDVINDVLDYSKIEAGKMTVERIPLLLRETIESVVEVLATAAADKGLELVADLPADLPVRILGDPVRLRQVLLNLVGNAVKFTLQGHILVQARICGATLELTVADTGIGIPETALPQLFAPFHQVDASVSRKFGGSGLGLAISRQLVERMSGVIQVESQVGVGTRFEVRLPLEIVEAAPPPTRSGPRTLTYLGPSLMEPVIRGWAEAHQIHYRSELDLTATGPHTLLLDIDRCEPDAFGQWWEVAQAQGGELLLSGSPRNRHRFPPPPGVPPPPFLPKPLKYRQFLGALHLLEAPEMKPAEAFPSSQPGRRPQRVLVVEDNLINQRVAVGLLKKLGIEPDLAADGVEALRSASEKTYDVIFMDCQMPRMDGFQAARELRARERTAPPNPRRRRAVIIALTAAALPWDEQRCREAGMDDFLTKPIDLQKLAAALDRWSIPAERHEDSKLALTA